MIAETITIIKLVASEGNILTNGETYGSVIFLEEGLSAEDFYEITREAYEELLAEQAAEDIWPEEV